MKVLTINYFSQAGCTSVRSYKNKKQLDLLYNKSGYAGSNSLKSTKKIIRPGS
ncbi:MAG: hypothetical protein ACOCUV_00255 [bacterium]